MDKIFEVGDTVKVIRSITSDDIYGDSYYEEVYPVGKIGQVEVAMAGFCAVRINGDVQYYYTPELMQKFFEVQNS